MVHTRHSRDVEPDSPPRFLSLEGRRSKKLRSHAADVDEQDSDQSGIVYHSKGHSIFEDKVVESRLRPRTGPRAYNYVYEDSSDDDIMARNCHVRVAEGSSQSLQASSHQIQHETHRRESDTSDEEDDEEPKQRARWYKTSNKPMRQTRSRQQLSRHGDGEDEPDGEANQEEDEDEEDGNNSALRRSNRLREKPYRFRNPEQKNGDSSRNVDRGKRRRTSDVDENEEYDDMYSRVKRTRTKKADSREQHSASDNSNDEKNSDGEGQQRRSYSLREHKPRTQLYSAPAIEVKRKPKQPSLFRETPPRQSHKDKTYRSPAHRIINSRKRQAFHGSSSSTSSDPDSGTETSDEQHFSRRKAKSLAKARARICPLNFTNEMLTSSVKDRVRAGASLADVDPMEIDKSVTFESVGGLQKHIMALKEMAFFPLLYSDYYDRYKVVPSRGVLFYGPPGTGKTLVARALANECSRGSKKVSFFMRKGADCLSKWVGEAERQLRLLFDKAYEMRPSIIFFDEIDGLAPVRSSRQDQIHSSIVSTLLALMDGIDSRGEIVIIGATNRIDAIDPALRRPGRFDKEFLFTLPSLDDRKKILEIHTKSWSPLLRDDFLFELAEKCAGYCGADIKCMVTEATQNALRRHYPQIYTTSDKLQLNISAIQLIARDFAQAMSNIVPAAQRAVASPAMALEASVRPLLAKTILKLQALLIGRFPYAKADRRAAAPASEQESSLIEMELASDEEDNAPSIFRSNSRSGKSSTNQTTSSFLTFTRCASSFPTVFRPRMLVCGPAGQGQSVHLAPAALHLMEHLPVHILNSSTLFAASAKMPEEACANVFHEAKRTAPSIIFMPFINELWHVVTDSMRVTFLTLVRSMNPSTPVLIMATSETCYKDLEEQLVQLFSQSGGEVFEVTGPTAEERRQFFSDLILQQTVRPPSTHKQAALRVLEPLTKAPQPEPHKLTDKEQKKLIEQEEDTLRELRIFLRDIVSKLWREKKFIIFTKPVDIDEVPDYYDIVKKPMDLSTVMSNIDLHKYNTAASFLDDIFLICCNALEYNPDRGPTDRAIRHRACALRDMAQALLKAELDPDFEKICQEIEASRKNRGVDSSQNAPAFYHTRPHGGGLGSSLELSAEDTLNIQSQVPAIPEGCRFSRRVRGLDADRTSAIEAVEKTVHVEKNLLKKDQTPEKEKSSSQVEQDTSQQTVVLNGDDPSESINKDSAEKTMEEDKVEQTVINACNCVEDCKCPHTPTKNPSHIHSGNKGTSTKHPTPEEVKRAKRLKSQSPWCRPRRRRRLNSTPTYKHNKMQSHGSDGEEVSDEDETSIQIEHVSPRSSHNWADRCQREHSPVSAANPANVNVSGRTRRSLDTNTPSPEHAAEETSAVTVKQKDPTSHGDEKSNKTCSTIENLDVELMTAAIDSGLGSESNGDSRDSQDQNNSNRCGTSSNVEKEKENGDDETATVSAGGPSFAHTRSRTQNSLQMNALAALEVEMRSVQVDRERLANLLDKTVAITNGFTVERLQHLYSMLSCCIYNNRRQYDKTELVQEMEQVVENFCHETGH